MKVKRITVRWTAEMSKDVDVDYDDNAMLAFKHSEALESEMEDAPEPDDLEWELVSYVVEKDGEEVTINCE
jgi:hypothetical protein